MVNNISFKNNPAYNPAEKRISEARANAFAKPANDTPQKAQAQTSVASDMYNLIPDFLKLKASALGWGSGIASATISSLLTGGAILGTASAYNNLKEAQDNGFFKTAGNVIKNTASALWNKAKGATLKGTGQAIAKPFKAFWATSVGDVFKGAFVKLPAGTINYVKGANTSKAVKTLAVGAGVMAYGYQMFKAFLNINKQHAEIDHKFKVGHNN